MCHNLFIYSPTEGHLGCLQIWAVMNAAAINILVQFFCADISFLLFWVNTKGRDCLVIWSKYVWFCKKLPNCLPKQLYHFYSHQQRMRVPVTPHPPQHLLLPVSQISASLTGVYSISLFLFAFPWRHRTRSIFSCAYLPSIYVLWWGVCSGLWPIF